MLQRNVNKLMGKITSGPVAQWITRLTTDQKIPGSNPGRFGTFYKPIATNGDKQWCCRLNWIYNDKANIPVSRVRISTSLHHLSSFEALQDRLFLEMKYDDTIVYHFFFPKNTLLTEWTFHEWHISSLYGKQSGESGYRSRYLSHAKRALYHLS